MLEQQKIQHRVLEIRAEREERLSLTGDKIIEEMQAIAFANVVDYLELQEDDDGNLVYTMRDLTALSEEKQRAIKEVEIDDNGKVKIKFYDKLTALQALAKMYGLYSDFSQAINALKKFDIFIRPNRQGTFTITDMRNSNFSSINNEQLN